MTIGATCFAFVMVKRRRFRKALYTFGFFSWFVCPEWPSAYFMPEKRLIDLCNDDSASSVDGGKVKAKATIISTT